MRVRPWLPSMHSLFGGPISPADTNCTIKPKASSAGATANSWHNAEMNWRDRIVADPGVLVGKAVVKGTRISVELVMDLLARGYTQQQILDQHPHLVAEDLQACLGYAADVLREERMFRLRA